MRRSINRRYATRPSASRRGTMRRSVDRIRSILISQKGDVTFGGLILLSMATFALAANVLNLYGATGTIENKRIATERVEELRATAEAKFREAKELEKTDPAAADVRRHHAQMLKDVADSLEGHADVVYEAEKKDLEGELPEYVPDREYMSEEVLMALEALAKRYTGLGLEGVSDIPYVLGQIKKKGELDDKQLMRELGAIIGDRIQKEDRVYRAVVWARLISLYRAQGEDACFSYDGRPTNEEAWAVAVNRLRRLYDGSTLTRRDAFRKAMQDITGQPFGSANVSLAGCTPQSPPAGSDDDDDDRNDTGDSSGADDVSIAEPDSPSIELPATFSGSGTRLMAPKNSVNACKTQETLDLTLHPDGRVTGTWGYAVKIYGLSRLPSGQYRVECHETKKGTSGQIGGHHAGNKIGVYLYPKGPLAKKEFLKGSVSANGIILKGSASIPGTAIRVVDRWQFALTRDR